MTTFGITTEGFKLKRLADIQIETSEAFKAAFGDGINLDPESFLGQIKGILDERESLIWELAQAVYKSQYPLTSSGTSLDQVASITGVTRLLATNSKVNARIFGDLGTVVPIGFVASVSGNEDSKFETKTSDTVHAGIDEVQKLSFDSVPTGGTFKLQFGGQDTPAMDQTTTNTDIQNNLNALNDLSEVAVTGDFATRFTVTFAGADGKQDQALLIISENTLVDGATQVIITVTEETKGYPPFVDITMTAQQTGPIQANAGSLTEIETPVSGIDSVTNLEDTELGRNTETDSELKLRRLELLQRRGTATIEGIRNEVLTVLDVLQAVVVENTTTQVDGGGRPPKSFEVFVLGGTDSDIANAIFRSKPAGIETHGSISESVIDSQGLAHTVKFSRAIEKDIYIEVNITGNTNPSEGELYPSNGDQLVEDSLLSFLQGFKIGQDVIVNLMYTPINTIPGVIGVEILVGLSPNPTTSNNISISAPEIARFDSSRIEVNS
jgi:uncharacterized phage protein gp47/JayE